VTPPPTIIFVKYRYICLLKYLRGVASYKRHLPLLYGGSEGNHKMSRTG